MEWPSFHALLRWNIKKVKQEVRKTIRINLTRTLEYYYVYTLYDQYLRSLTKSSSDNAEEEQEIQLRLKTIKSTLDLMAKLTEEAESDSFYDCIFAATKFISNCFLLICNHNKQPGQNR